MARILYIFPHPDDECFGPAPAIARQQRQGHEVFLLTLTHGEATKQRKKFGYSKDEMAQARHREMQDVARTLHLADLTVLDFPDGGLPDLDPLVLEDAITRHVERVRPHVLVTYAVHGCSGHPDHLVGHAVVKRVFCALRRDGAAYLQRLAFFTLPEENTTDRPVHLKGSPDEAIDCVVSFTEDDLAAGKEALACYTTYRDVIQEHRPLRHVRGGVCFELFGEHHAPPLDDSVKSSSHRRALLMMP